MSNSAGGRSFRAFRGLGFRVRVSRFYRVDISVYRFHRVHGLCGAESFYGGFVQGSYKGCIGLSWNLGASRKWGGFCLGHRGLEAQIAGN